MPDESQSQLGTADCIRIRGARQHNLRNLDLDLPRNQLIVITGPSGSGKSSLAFDTLFAEGQRKYLESLSTHARQFLERLPRPDVDHISGLPPSIAIAQQAGAGGPRSTVATITEIYDYLRVLYSIAGKPYDPTTGEPLRRLTVSEIVEQLIKLPNSSKIWLLAPVARNSPPPHNPLLARLLREGYLRARINGELVELDDADALAKFASLPISVEAVVDRIILKGDAHARLTDSTELALRVGKGQMNVLVWSDNEAESPKEMVFSTEYRNPQTGFRLPKLTPRHFSFNSPEGACLHCAGLGFVEAPDEAKLLLPELSISDGGILFYRILPQALRMVRQHEAEQFLVAAGFSAETPLCNLPPHVLKGLLHGTKSNGSSHSLPSNFEGLLAQLERLIEHSESAQLRHKLRMFYSQQVCPECKGSRLRKESLSVYLEIADGSRYNLSQFCSLSVERALEAIRGIKVEVSLQKAASEIVAEVSSRLEFLDRTGLGYLGLDRESGTLSGGEARRVRLAAQLGSSLSGVLYVLDEPSIGLHPRDHSRLLELLHCLRDAGNTVVVVEHDEQTIRAADWVLELGPGAGEHGGKIVASGTLAEVLATSNSLTARFLRGEETKHRGRRKQLPLRSEEKQRKGEGWLGIIRASEHNLKEVTVYFPVGCFSCLTGVSGSGKSTLLNDILAPAMRQSLYGTEEIVGKHAAIVGGEQFDKVIVVDQSPIGRTPRSNPATYLEIFGYIRELFSKLPESRARGYDARRFSLNAPGGRCERCQGEGYVRLEMQFLPDAFVECEACGGRRYNRETLEVLYKGRSIADVLEMSIEEAAFFFRSFPQIARKLQTMQKVGLGYLRLGQPANTLSGGEAQRMKLASELGKKDTGRTLYLLDEPTTGLHFADVKALIEVLLQLRDAGNTILVIEHHLDVIACADYIVDLGPEAGERGGEVVVCGTPEEVAACEKSHTGRFLREVLRQ